MFKNFFKKQPPKQGGREVETAVVLMLYADGGPTVPILKVEGIKQKREATMNDLYRMVNDVKGQIDEIRVSDSVVGSLVQILHRPPAQAPGPAPVKDEKEIGDATHKEEDVTHKASEDNKK